MLLFALESYQKRERVELEPRPRVTKELLEITYKFLGTAPSHVSIPQIRMAKGGQLRRENALGKTQP